MKVAFATSYQISADQQLFQMQQSQQRQPGQPPNAATNAAVDGNLATSASRELNLKAQMASNSNILLKSSESFKVLTECPLIVMLLFQLYPKFIKVNITQMVPFMMSALALRTPRVAYKVQRTRFRELLAAQVARYRNASATELILF